MTRSFGKHLIYTLLLLIVAGVFWVEGIYVEDQDFGWHLRVGEIILTEGIPATDPFSYTMQDFPWVDHSWLTDAGIAWLYQRVGIPGLALMFALIVVGAIQIAVARVSLPSLRGAPPVAGRRSNLEQGDVFPRGRLLGDFAVFPYILAFAALLPFFRIRTQVVSWLLFSLLVWILFSGKRWRILRWTLPILFIVWANIHASFVGGLVALVIVLALKYFRESSQEWCSKSVAQSRRHGLSRPCCLDSDGTSVEQRFLAGKSTVSSSNTFLAASIVGWMDALVVVFSMGATLINPYGVGMWREVVMTLFNPLAQGQVDEWRSVFTMSELNVAAVLFSVLSVVLVWRARKGFLLEEHGLYWALFLQAVMTKRLLPLWIIVALPLTYRAVRLFYDEAASLPHGRARFRKACTFLWIASIVFFGMQAVLFSGVVPMPNALRVPYPAQAVAYLRDNLPEGNIFSSYGWGGYLIRRLPEKKTFIDGRMAHWYWLPPDDNNLPSVLDLYLNIVSGAVPYAGAFGQFHVDTVLWPAPREQYLIERVGQYTEQYFWGREIQGFDLLEALKRDGWQLVYEDGAAVIYQRPIEGVKKLRN